MLGFSIRFKVFLKFKSLLDMICKYVQLVFSIVFIFCVFKMSLSFSVA